jgi:hypothetical protein
MWNEQGLSFSKTIDEHHKITCSTSIKQKNVLPSKSLFVHMKLKIFLVLLPFARMKTWRKLLSRLRKKGTIDEKQNEIGQYENVSSHF